MYELFNHLLERQDKFYGKHPQPYLRLIDTATRTRFGTHNTQSYLTLFELLVASSAHESLLLGFPDSPDRSFVASLASKVAALEATVVARCVNLVEIIEDPPYGKALRAQHVPEELTKADNLVVRFIHRSAQDFLVDSNQGANLLRSCEMTEQSAVIRLTTASLTKFLLDYHECEVARPLELGKLIEAEFWARAGTKALDIVFPTLQNRQPLFTPMSRPNSPAIHLTTAFDVMCPQLSTLETLSFGFATNFRMVAYTEAKLRALQPEKLPFAVGFCLTLYFRNYKFDYESGFQDMLKSYLSLTSITQSLSLCYVLEPYNQMEPWFFATCPVWQHIYLALVDLKYEEAPARLMQEILCLLRGSTSDATQPVRLTGCIIRNPFDRTITRIFPMPDGPASSFTKTIRESILRVTVRIHDDAETYSFDFSHYAPAGLGRFLELEESHNSLLQQTFSDDESLSCGYEASQECLIDILAHHWEGLSIEEKATVVRCYDGNPCIIVNKGMLQVVASMNEKRAWEDELYKNAARGDCNDDPVEREIIKSIQRSVDWEGHSESSISSFRMAEETSSGCVASDDLAADQE